MFKESGSLQSPAVSTRPRKKAAANRPGVLLFYGEAGYGPL